MKPESSRSGSLSQSPALWMALLVLVPFAAVPWWKSEDSRKIRITNEIAAEIALERQAITGIPPTPEELDLLVRNHVDEEILLREAAARGIDCSGCNGRKHLINRILFVLEKHPDDPTESDLREYFSEHRESYQVPERISFEHAFFPEALPETEQPEILASLEGGSDPMEVGERFWMGNLLERITREEVAAVMGPSFADSVFDDADSNWSGPHQSSRGLHFVRVTSEFPSRLAEFEEVRILVEQAYTRHQRTEMRENLVAQFRKGYEVTIEPLERIL